MALRKTYFNLDPIISQKIDLDVSEFLTYPRHKSLYDSMSELIEKNTRLNKYNSRLVNYESFNIDIFLIGIVFSENKKSNPESTVEICPRWDSMRGNPKCLTIMVRYLDDKDLEIFEEILYRHFEVHYVENDE